MESNLCSSLRFGKAHKHSYDAHREIAKVRQWFSWYPVVLTVLMSCTS